MLPAGRLVWSLWTKILGVKAASTGGFIGAALFREKWEEGRFCFTGNRPVSAVGGVCHSLYGPRSPRWIFRKRPGSERGPRRKGVGGCPEKQTPSY